MIQNVLLVLCHVVAHKQQLHEINNFFSFLSWDKGLVFQACCKRGAPKGLTLLVDKAGSIGLKTFERDRKDERAEPHLKLQTDEHQSHQM